MDETPTLARNGDDRLFKGFQAQFGAPAYVRRARAVEAELENLLLRCGQQREDLLSTVRMRVGMLRALAGAWESVSAWLADADQLAVLRDLEATLRPQLRIRVEPTSSCRILQRALRKLVDSIQRFNRRWLARLATVDLTRVNELRDGYNRYYLLEKECAMLSPRLARQGFCRLEPLTTDHLALLLPVLPVPQLAAT